ncbi:UNVERIFIED_CONTAM: hypothetical protein Sradi_3120900 [Sesamum radiatum]|uniref:RING-type domain-containing protein n=1 Tax=Sesamum radiatum TaxID=300843 RepID=A0AAW2RDN8_SESRA
MKTRLKPRGNGKTSAVGNMLMKGSKAKRKRSDSNNCHQCHRRDKERVVRCTKCKQKNYCIPCITRWYPTMEEIDCAEACPVCRDICNCAACLQSNAANKDLIPDVKLCTKDKVQHSRHIVRVILPYLKEFVAEQNMEREEEARIQAVIQSCNLTSLPFSEILVLEDPAQTSETGCRSDSNPPKWLDQALEEAKTILDGIILMLGLPTCVTTAHPVHHFLLQACPIEKSLPFDKTLYP